MKKSVLALAMAFGVTGAFATIKKNEDEPSDIGDWGLPEPEPLIFTSNTSSFTNPTPKIGKGRQRKNNNRKGHKRKKAKNGRK